MAAAEQKLAYARTLYATEKVLWEDKVTARQDFTRAAQDLREAEIAFDNARQKLRALGIPGSGGPFNRLDIRAPFDGLIVEKHITPGESVGADTRYSHLRPVHGVGGGGSAGQGSRHRPRRHPGNFAFDGIDGGGDGQGEFCERRDRRADPLGAGPRGAGQSATGLAAGLFVDVDIVTGAAEVTVAVDKAALQNVDGRQIVYRKVEGGFIAQPVVAGRSDGAMVEIVEGLAAGQAYAAAGSFTVKAEQGKGEAGHAD